MGFFSDLGNKIKNGFKKVVATVGNKLKEWGDRLSNKVTNVVKPTADIVGDLEEYTDSNTHVVDNVSTQLSNFLEEIEEIADEIENKCFAECNSYYLDIIKIVETSNMDIDVSSLHAYIKKTRNSVKGFLKSYISKKVSIDNNECRAILKLNPGIKKTNRMEQFQKKVLSEGLAELCAKVDVIVQKQNRYIQNYFDDISRNLENKYQTTMEDCQKFESISISNSELKKQEILKHTLIISFCDNILSEFQD